MINITAGGSQLIDDGIGRIRRELSIPEGFSAEVLAAAAGAGRPASGGHHVDRTEMGFVTLDPVGSTDLDQAFCIETSGSDLILHYAIADVGWFVGTGDALDREAWLRGTTMYVPNGKSPLYPASLSEGAASLLPSGPRPAVVFTVRLDEAGVPRLDGVERAIIRSRGQLAYATVTDAELPPQLPEFARRMDAADARRGASRLEPPEQDVEHGADGYRIAYRPRLASESANAALSLATNLAVASALFTAGTGLYRVLDEPDEGKVRQLRLTAVALGVGWPAAMTLADFQRTLVGTDARQAAMMMAIRRAGGAARYVPFQAGVVPWHAAMAATYVHATAPLRRLADRYVVLAALAVANGEAVPDHVEAAFTTLPEVMERADSTGNRLDRSVIDLVEAVVLQGHEGDTFAAVVTDLDDRGARIQLCDVAVVARVSADDLEPGAAIRVRLVEASPEKRSVRFECVS